MTEYIHNKLKGYNVFSNIRYYTLKHNPITSSIAKFYLDRLCKDLEMLIFVATTGRSATATLTGLFQQIDGCSSHHEPYPAMHGQIMIKRNNGDNGLARFTYDMIKSVNIRRLAMGYKYYVETNHMFIKTFIDYVVDDFSQKVKIIHLIRDPIQVADSITRLNQYPGSEIGNQWWLDYHAPGNIIQLADILDDAQEFKDNFYKSLWYWYEIEARVAFWKTHLPNVPFFDFNVEDIGNLDKVCDLMDRLELRHERHNISHATKLRINQKDHSKIHPPISRKQANKMHKKFQGLLISRGYSVPF